MSTLTNVQTAKTWDQRVDEIRLLPMHHGKATLTELYAEIARTLYVPHIAPDFAYIPSDENYDLPTFGTAYRAAHSLTKGFTEISEANLQGALSTDSRTLLVFRTITGLLRKELAPVTKQIAERDGLKPKSIGDSTIRSCENGGGKLSDASALLLARTLSDLMNGLYSTPPPGRQSKQDKADTRRGWSTVAHLAANGVPYEEFLHQRHYGGSFAQLSNATGTKKGDALEDAVELLFIEAGVPFIRTGSHNQGEIVKRFGVSMNPAPDFVVFDDRDQLKALIECKSINDGGTARDKAARFRNLREEASRLGGHSVIAVLDGLGWTRVNDALGPVVAATDGRVFTTETLPELLTVTPISSLLDLTS